jgi:hypothetical protein
VGVSQFIRDASATPTGIKREWYVCMYVYLRLSRKLHEIHGMLRSGGASSASHVLLPLQANSIQVPVPHLLLFPALAASLHHRRHHNTHRKEAHVSLMMNKIII